MATDKIKLEYPEWEKQKREPVSAYTRFRIFRNLGPTRTYYKAALALDIPESKIQGTVKSIGNMASKYLWQERISKYENYLTQIETKEQASAIKEMARRHADHSKSFETALMIPFKSLQQKLKNSAENDFDDMKISELYDKIVRSADAFHKITNVERLSRGEPTDINELQTDEDGIMIILPESKSKNE